MAQVDKNTIAAGILEANRLEKNAARKATLIKLVIFGGGLFAFAAFADMMTGR